jgi:macrolide transport system ATP-binding/permease protein
VSAFVQLRGVSRVYGEGDARVCALDGVDLAVGQGEFLALMGPSGSGKSTCLNVVGCLDEPTAGSYLFHGVEVTGLTRDQRSLLRRTYLGFVFQGYNLLPRTTALENVELPLIYRGMSARERRTRSLAALAAVGLADRANHAPNELSGGQQQRVAIARALVTEPELLLADEPTGNLDTARSIEIMELLKQMNRERGLTILMVTHEEDMAALRPRRPAVPGRPHRVARNAGRRMIWTTFRLAVRQLARNPVRTALTSLGVLIGVARGHRHGEHRAGGHARRERGPRVHRAEHPLRRARGGGHGPNRGSGRLFDEGDLAAVEREIDGVRSVAPLDSQPVVAAWESETWRTSLYGTTNAYLDAMGWKLSEGRPFEEGELIAGSDVCIVGETVVDELVGAMPPLDLELRAGTLTCRVVGVLEPKGQNTFGQDQDDLVLVPLRTFQRRLRGNRSIATLLVSAEDGAESARVKRDLEALFRERRHVREGAEADFTVRDMAEVLSMLNQVSTVLTGFLAAVAAVSLLVGGIGIMNIMLVSVTERTREIGIRLAVGALPRDVLLQFLVESVVLSGLGGLLGIVAGIGISALAAWGLGIPLVVEPIVVLLAFTFSAVIGVLFGYFPARRAARLRPIDALRHE